MLPESYQNQLKSQLGQPAYLLLMLLVDLLQSLKTVSIEKLATGLAIPIQFESRRRKIQRFLLWPILRIDELWLPLVKLWIRTELVPGKIYYLAIDRTCWGRINLLVVSMIWHKRAIPIYWQCLNKLGSSNLAEQQQIISKVIPLFLVHKVCVLGDREFCAVALANWLRAKNLYFSLRLKRSHYIEIQSGKYQQLSDLGLCPGVSLFLAGVKVTKGSGFAPFNLAGKWSKTIKGKQQKEGWLILTNFNSFQPAITAYEQRFSIEEMFRDFKKGGYNLESTQVEGHRLISLTVIMAIAYLSATLNGQTIKHQGCQKYLGRIREAGRTVRRHSSFYLGSMAEFWTQPSAHSAALIAELLTFSSNKCHSYLQGERARKLILARL